MYTTIIDKIYKVNINRSFEKSQRTLIKFGEEFGEFSEAYLSTTAQNHKNKTFNDVREESIDTLIMAVDLLYIPLPYINEDGQLCYEEIGSQSYTKRRFMLSHKTIPVDNLTLQEYESMMGEIIISYGMAQQEYTKLVRSMTNGLSGDLNKQADCYVEAMRDLVNKSWAAVYIVLPMLDEPLPKDLTNNNFKIYQSIEAIVDTKLLKWKEKYIDIKDTK